MMKERFTKIGRALISVSDKKDILKLTKILGQFSVPLLSSGGTAQYLRDNRVKVTEVSEYTAQSEILGGRVKTLHPKIHGGILAKRSDEEHLSSLIKHEIKPIDLVVVNLYPFEKTIAKEGVEFEEAIENIDIGGPSLIRAAAKNWEDVTVVVSPEDYPALIDELENNKGMVSKKTRFRLAQKAFAHTARYDGAISNWFTGVGENPKKQFSEIFNFQVEKIQDLRYGENPHQKGAFYRDRELAEPCVSNTKQLQGKELSFNNILDLDGAIELLKEFDEAACVILKHTTACGVARGRRFQGRVKKIEPLVSIFTAARDCDPLSAFGGIIGFNRPVDTDTATEIVKDFYEVVVAPDFDPLALAIFKEKRNLRVMQLPQMDVIERKGYDMKKVAGGLLIQDRNLDQSDIRKSKVVTTREPTEEEWESLSFAWRVVKHVKSNAVVFANLDRTLGIGAGQMSRVDSVKMAIEKGKKALKAAHGAVMASEAFFPFRDSIDEAAKVGVKAIIHPGGSLRDEESIQAANDAGIAMVFTGIRHFRH